MRKIIFALSATISSFCWEVPPEALMEPMVHDNGIALFHIPLNQISISKGYEITPIDSSDSDENVFKFTSSFLKPNHSYLLTLTSTPPLDYVYMRSFKIDENGKFYTWVGKEQDITIKLDEISDGEIINLKLYDVEDRTYINGTLTPIPKIYSLGAKGKVRFDIKLPLPFVGVEFEGMEPNEKVIIEADHKIVWFYMDENGCCKNDLKYEDWTKKELQRLMVICSEGEFSCPLPLDQGDWVREAKRDIVIRLSL